jgi:hypothetical protein
MKNLYKVLVSIFFITTYGLGSSINVPSGYSTMPIIDSSDRNDTLIYFIDNLEGDVSEWYLDGMWDISTTSYSSPTHSFNADDNSVNSSQDLISPIISIPNENELDSNEVLTLSFDIWCDMPGWDQDTTNTLGDYYIVSIWDTSETPPAHLTTTGAYSGNSWWFGDETSGGYFDGWLVFLDSPVFTVPSFNAQLIFKTKYDIEAPSNWGDYDGWDVANIRISTDGFETWDVLNGTPSYNVTSAYGWYYHGEGLNIPGWGGNSGGWIDGSFDISSYSGQSVQIRFAFGSDAATIATGWWIDDVQVFGDSGVVLEDNGDNNIELVPSGIPWVDLIYDYGASSRPGGEGWATYHDGMNYNGSLNIDNYTGKDVRFKFRSVLGDSLNPQGTGLWIDDLRVVGITPSSTSNIIHIYLLDYDGTNWSNPWQPMLDTYNYLYVNDVPYTSTYNGSSGNIPETTAAFTVELPDGVYQWNFFPIGSGIYCGWEIWDGPEWIQIIDGIWYDENTLTGEFELPVGLPHAIDQTVSTDEDRPLCIVLSGTDFDSNTLTFNITTMPTNGTMSTIGTSWIHSSGFFYITILYIPYTNYYGSDQLTFTVSDGSNTSSPATVSIDIIEVNDSPTTSNIPDQVIDEDLDTLLIPFTVNDVDNNFDDIILFGNSSDSSLIHPNNIVFTGYGSDRIVSIIPSPNQYGNATITIAVDDDGEIPPVYPSLENDFECLFPEDWTRIDNDNDGWNWTLLSGSVPHSGNFCIGSASWRGTALTPDNYLITPPLSLSGNEELHYWVSTLSSSFPEEHYYVKLSTTGTNSDDFTAILFEETLTESNTIYQERVIDLSTYEGDSIYIAWIHTEVTNMFWMTIDDISIVNTTNRSVSFNTDFETPHIQDILTNINTGIIDRDLEQRAFSTTSFELTVNAVNDAPSSFALNEQDSVYITMDNFDSDSIVFAWDESADVDDDELTYHFTAELIINGQLTTEYDTTLTANELKIDYQSVFDEIYAAQAMLAAIEWDVSVSDGVEEVMAENGPLTVGINASDAVLSINEELLPEKFALHQNYPNPFNPITTLRYDLPENGLVNITIYDMLGRQVKTLINQTQDAGFKSVIWNATNDYGKPVSAGVYLYQIQAGEFVQTRKMVLLK